jgi:hypothetical protein
MAYWISARLVRVPRKMTAQKAQQIVTFEVSTLRSPNVCRYVTGPKCTKPLSILNCYGVTGVQGYISLRRPVPRSRPSTLASPLRLFRFTLFLFLAGSKIFQIIPIIPRFHLRSEDLITCLQPLTKTVLPSGPVIPEKPGIFIPFIPPAQSSGRTSAPRLGRFAYSSEVGQNTGGRHGVRSVARQASGKYLTADAKLPAACNGVHA